MLMDHNRYQYLLCMTLHCSSTDVQTYVYHAHSVMLRCLLLCRMEKERQEIERLHNMTEEEREREFKSRAKLVTNMAPKGKYKFLQKYYHRGAFYLVSEG